MSEDKTIPVILLGPEPIEAKGFDRVVLSRQTEEGLKEIETHLGGVISVQMIGSTLHVIVEKRKPPSP